MKLIIEVHDDDGIDDDIAETVEDEAPKLSADGVEVRLVPPKPSIGSFGSLEATALHLVVEGVKSAPFLLALRGVFGLISDNIKSNSAMITIKTNGGEIQVPKSVGLEKAVAAAETLLEKDAHAPTVTADEPA